MPNVRLAITILCVAALTIGLRITDLSAGALAEAEAGSHRG